MVTYAQPIAPSPASVPNDAADYLYTCRYPMDDDEVFRGYRFRFFITTPHYHLAFIHLYEPTYI